MVTEQAALHILPSGLGDLKANQVFEQTLLHFGQVNLFLDQAAKQANTQPMALALVVKQGLPQRDFFVAGHQHGVRLSQVAVAHREVVGKRIFDGNQLQLGLCQASALSQELLLGFLIATQREFQIDTKVPVGVTAFFGDHAGLLHQVVVARAAVAHDKVCCWLHLVMGIVQADLCLH